MNVKGVLTAVQLASSRGFVLLSMENQAILKMKATAVYVRGA